MNNEHEHKAFRFALESVGEGGEFSGYAAVFGNLDSGGDIIERGAFTKTIVEDFDRIKILSQHREHDLPIGKPLELREDEKGLYIRGKISDTQSGRDVQTLLRDGVLTELSIGFEAIEYEMEIDDDKPIEKCVRRLKEIRLWEVSVVTWAMNEQAKIDEVKSLAESLTAEVKAGKIPRSRMERMKPFIAVVRELAEILGSLLEAQPDTAGEPPPGDVQDNIKQQTKNAGMVFEIVPSKTRR